MKDREKSKERKLVFNLMVVIVCVIMMCLIVGYCYLSQI